MNAGLALQYVVIAVAVLLSAWVVAHKQFPKTTRRLRTAIAARLLREGHPSWLKWLGKKLAPPSKTGGSACGGCTSCGPDTLGKRK